MPQNIDEVLSDPEFHQQPLSTRLAILRTYPEFSALSPKDQGGLIAHAQMGVNGTAAAITPPKDPGFWNTLGHDISSIPGALMATGTGEPGDTRRPGIIPAIGAAQHAEFQKGRDRSRPMYERVAHTAAAAVPVLGPMAAQIGDEIGGGQPGAASAHALEMISPFGAKYEAAENMGRVGELPSASSVVNRVRQSGFNPLRVNPTTASVRALRPPPTAGSFIEDIPSTISTIKAANPGFKPKVTDGKLNVPQAAQKAISVYQEALQGWLDRAEGQKISGTPIIQATQEGIDSLLPSEQIAARRPFERSGLSLLERARQDYGGYFSPQELRDRLALLNERLSPFYNKSAQAQSTALADIPEAVLKRQRDAVANTLYQYLDPENEGAGPRSIQEKTGDLINFRDAALRRQNAIAAEQPLTPLGRIVDPLKGAIRGIIPGKATGAGIAFAEGSEGRSLPLLKRAFNAVDEAPGVNDIGTIPRPGPRQIPGPSDASGPTGYNPATVGDSPFAPRALPPASIQMPPVPDPSFVRGMPATPGFRVGFPQLALPPASPGFLDTELGSQYGDITGSPPPRPPQNPYRQQPQ